MRPPRGSGLVGAAFGVVAVGAAVGLAAERRFMGRTRERQDDAVVEPFFALPADRSRVVMASDGVPLHVEEVGPADAALTVVFLHGYIQEMAGWHYQRQDLGEDNPGRLVFYDHRSHGRSGRGAPENATIDQLGRDLETVLAEVVPEGEVVLVGHSMGGMTIMALAQSRPELFGSRVVGVALISTSTGKLDELTFGLPSVVRPISRVVVPLLSRGVRRRPATFERTRQLGSDLVFLIARRTGFGDQHVSPALVQFVEEMAARTPVDVMAEFYDTLTTHDRLAALDAVQDIEVLVLVGSKDLVTPLEHSQAMADLLPSATLTVVEGAGHMVQLERATLVTSQLRSLVERARERKAVRTG
ncbi:MAG: alpha/beta hydrolase fold protein [Frankiales bacterium]|nr:alpha/beta hydrolase fold protein [Frankiales bacterium]